MLVKTLSEVNEQHPDLLELARDLLKRAENRFAEILQQARAQGEILPASDTGILAKHLQVQMIGLRIYMKTSGNSQAVSELISSVFRAISIK